MKQTAMQLQKHYTAEVLPSGDPTQSVFEKFISLYAKNPLTQKTYRHNLKVFLQWVSDQGRVFWELEEDHFTEYQQYLSKVHTPRKRNGKPKYEKRARMSVYTVNNYFTTVREFYKYLEVKYKLNNFTRLVKSASIDNDSIAHRKEALTVEESKRLSLWAKEKRSPRDHAILSLMQETGLRTIEVVRAKVGDITIVDGSRIMYIQGKGSVARDQEIRLSDKLFRIITNYLSLREAEFGTIHPDAFLFISEGYRYKKKNADGIEDIEDRQLTTRTVSQLVKKGLRAIGLDNRNYTAHCLRHTVGTTIYETTRDIREVQKALRHSSLNTSEVYARRAIRSDNIKNSPLLLIEGLFVTE